MNTLLWFPEFKCSPISQLTTLNKMLTSPSKSGSTVTMLDFSTKEIDEFNDEFNMDDFEEVTCVKTCYHHQQSLTVHSRI